MKYMTDGMLLREFLSEPDLASYRYFMNAPSKFLLLFFHKCKCFFIFSCQMQCYHGGRGA